MSQNVSPRDEPASDKPAPSIPPVVLGTSDRNEHAEHDSDVAPTDIAAAEDGGPARGPDGLLRTPWALSNKTLTAYYDAEWGDPVTSEQGVFERLSLEAFQSGLSWLTILKKRPAFRSAFHDFDVDAVAAFDDADVERLMADAGIVRNRAKILATIGNATATRDLRATGGLSELVWSFAPATQLRPRTVADVPTQSAESLALSKALRAHGFRFVGPTTMFALMEALGIVDTHLVGSHRRRHP